MNNLTKAVMKEFTCIFCGEERYTAYGTRVCDECRKDIDERVEFDAEDRYIKEQDYDYSHCSECQGKADICEDRIGDEVHFIKICGECGFKEEI